MNNKIKGLGMAALCFAATQQAEAKEQKPNIVFILIDDMGIRDLGCYGGHFAETPNIDKLATQSMRFTQAYASPVSSPTRTSILTGQNAARHGVWEVIDCHDRPYAKYKSPVFNEVISDDLESYADVLNREGYTCGLFGKWHTGRAFEKSGFAQIGSEIADPKLQEYAKINDPAMGTGTIVANTIEFVRNNKDNPFFVCLSHKLVHAPLEAREDLVNKYHKKMRDTGIDEISPTYAAMIEMVDESVKMMLDELDNLGIAENTVVIFYSDNGGLIYDRILSTPLAGSNLPYRDQKASLYEGGVHVPLMVKWPNKVEEGSTSDALMMTYDLFSTFVDLAGGKVKEGQIIDGCSLVPVLTQKEDKLPREAIYWHFPTNMWTRTPVGAIRKGNYKLIENFIDGSLELYDVVNDISEQVNLLGAKPDIATDLYNDMKAWREEVGAELPTLNPDFDPIRQNEMAKDWW